MSVANKIDIIKQVKILDLAEEYGVKLEQISTNKFDYRCSCPFSSHKNGKERTPSLYINSVNNDFYCFGCNSHSSVIDFYMKLYDVEFSDAMVELSKRIDFTHAHEDTTDNLIQPNIFSVLLNISNLIRHALLNHPEDLKWLNSVMKKTDRYIDDIGDKDVDGAKNLLDSLKQEIDKRYIN